MWLYMNSYEVQRLTSGNFLKCFPPYFFETDFSLNLELSDWLYWLADRVEESLSLPSCAIPEC